MSLALVREEIRLQALSKREKDRWDMVVGVTSFAHTVALSIKSNHKL